MDRPAFITLPMSQLLDIVRAGAALVVLAGHAVGFYIYTGEYPLDRSGPHNAVMVFFVLSGLVITHSAQAKQVGAGSYAAARIARIVPMTVAAVVFSLAVSLYGTAAGIDYSEPGPGPANVLLPLLFLSESPFGSGLVWNTPFWSLAYEAMYYGLFGIAVFASERTRWVLLALAVVLAGWKVLLLLPVWLMGVALARYGHRWTVGLAGGGVLIALGLTAVIVATHGSEAGTAMLSAVTGLTTEQLGFSEKALTDYAVGLGVALCFIGLRPVAERLASVLERCRNPIRIAADLSFPVYIFHLPMLVLLAAFGITAGTNLLVFGLILAGMIGVCAMIAAPVNRRAAGLRPLLERWFARAGKRQALRPA